MAPAGNTVMTKWEAFCRQVSVTDKDLGDKSSLIAIRE
ncbi:Hypothetical protein OINT_2000332 [Brucella intermedia LMG 3301]|uniref:Uncharacterized protein n=1 Tax=Brucella intermedia LMG 3301 TaxID=641118 RepID=C4WMN4_9HYPH|nr:Hypothetical protein OINT_2000332 [Brucella intermedia LMG 3301]